MFPITVIETRKGDGMLGYHHYFHIRHNQDRRTVSCTRRPIFTPKKIPWYSFLLQAEWTPGLLNADRRITSLEHFHGSHREPNTEPPVLWRSVSINWATDRPSV